MSFAHSIIHRFLLSVILWNGCCLASLSLTMFDACQGNCSLICCTEPALVLCRLNINTVRGELLNLLIKLLKKNLKIRTLRMQKIL